MTEPKTVAKTEEDPMGQQFGKLMLATAGAFAATKLIEYGFDAVVEYRQMKKDHKS
jgi:hypothetical protein